MRLSAALFPHLTLGSELPIGPRHLLVSGSLFGIGSLRCLAHAFVGFVSIFGGAQHCSVLNRHRVLSRRTLSIFRFLFHIIKSPSASVVNTKAIRIVPKLPALQMR